MVMNNNVGPGSSRSEVCNAARLGMDLCTTWVPLRPTASTQRGRNRQQILHTVTMPTLRHNAYLGMDADAVCVILVLLWAELHLHHLSHAWCQQPLLLIAARLCHCEYTDHSRLENLVCVQMQ